MSVQLVMNNVFRRGRGGKVQSKWGDEGAEEE